MLQTSRICLKIKTIDTGIRNIVRSSLQNSAAKPQRKYVKSKDLNNDAIKVAKIDSNQDNDASIKVTENVTTDLEFYNAIESFKDLPAEAPPRDLGFWQTPRGLEVKEEIWTATGRILRQFFTKERYDNLYETALERELNTLVRFNAVDELTLQHHGTEWALGQIIFNLGGAVKVKYDDRWIEDVRCIRTPKRKDFRLEGIDLRKSAVNHIGLKYLSGAQHVRYINAGDAQHFDDQAMACLHPLADSLEFLDVSGTAVTEKGLGYLRLFSKLRYLNLSRLTSAENLDQLLPFLHEILPDECSVITDDETPAELYGHPIPFRCPTNTKKDLPVMEGNKSIGDVTIYKQNMLDLNLYRLEAVHELWMTPVIGQRRHFKLGYQQDLDQGIQYKMAHYIVKANKYKPLF